MARRWGGVVSRLRWRKGGRFNRRNDCEIQIEIFYSEQHEVKLSQKRIRHLARLRLDRNACVIVTIADGMRINTD